MKLNTEVRECVGGYRLEFEGLSNVPGYSVGFVAYQRDKHPSYGGEISQEQARYNAERAVLVWNAFDGLSNDLIASMPGPVAELACLHADAVDKVRSLVLQQAHLLSVLQAIADDDYDAPHDATDSEISRNKGLLIARIRKLAGAAIAGASGN